MFNVFPTDSLYKFMTFSGLIIIILSITLLERVSVFNGKIVALEKNVEKRDANNWQVGEEGASISDKSLGQLIDDFPKECLRMLLCSGGIILGLCFFRFGVFRWFAMEQCYLDYDRCKNRKLVKDTFRIIRISVYFFQFLISIYIMDVFLDFFHILISVFLSLVIIAQLVFQIYYLDENQYKTWDF